MLPGIISQNLTNWPISTALLHHLNNIHATGIFGIHQQNQKSHLFQVNNNFSFLFLLWISRVFFLIAYFTFFSAGDWDNACNELQRMLIVRSLRPDRVAFCATSFIVNNLGSKFVEPPVLDMFQVLADSSKRTPLIFVLSPGVVSFKFPHWPKHNQTCNSPCCYFLMSKRDKMFS